jgi:hypothetical protein
LAWAVRTRAVYASAFALDPQTISSITTAVRRSRAYGSSSAPVELKKPSNATGCAAIISRARGPDRATTYSPSTRRIIASSSK